MINKEKSQTLVYWVVIVLLLAGCTFLFVTKNNKFAEQERIEKQNTNNNLDNIHSHQSD